MFNRLDDSARRAIVLAQEEAITCCAQEIGTGHLLYALAWMPETGARAVLGALGITPEAVREKLTKGEVKLDRPTPLSTNLRRVLVRGEQNAAWDSVVEKPIDLLGALVEIGEGTGVEILYELGLGLDEARSALTLYGWRVERNLSAGTVGA
jgi:ATP-dependent Clp protease ATP-binding subunit ClpC